MINVVGNSHVSLFTGHDGLSHLGAPGTDDRIEGITTWTVGAHLAYNLPTPGHPANVTFLQVLSKIPRGTIMLQFGEIDCRMHLVKHRNERNFGTIVRTAVERLLQAGRIARNLGFDVFLFSVHPMCRVGWTQTAGFCAGSYANITTTEYVFDGGLREQTEFKCASVFQAMIDRIRNPLYFFPDAFHLSQLALPLALEAIRQVGYAI